MKQRVAVPVLRGREANGGESPAERAAFGRSCTDVQLVKVVRNERICACSPDVDIHIYELTTDDAGSGT